MRSLVKLVVLRISLTLMTFIILRLLQVTVYSQNLKDCKIVMHKYHNRTSNEILLKLNVHNVRYTQVHKTKGWICHISKRLHSILHIQLSCMATSFSKFSITRSNIRPQAIWVVSLVLIADGYFNFSSVFCVGM